jgi:hypothetical protein
MPLTNPNFPTTAAPLQRLALGVASVRPDASPPSPATCSSATAWRTMQSRARACIRPPHTASRTRPLHPAELSCASASPVKRRPYAIATNEFTGIQRPLNRLNLGVATARSAQSAGTSGVQFGFCGCTADVEPAAVCACTCCYGFFCDEE